MRNGASQHNGKLRVALYGRVSTSDQNVGMQMEAIREYCSRSGYQVVDEYVDNGFSGKDDRRPDFERLLADMRQKRFDALVVYKLDRIGRSMKHLLNLFEEFKNLDMEFVSITQNINTTTAEGRMFLRLLMVFAEYERELIVARTRDGVARARRNGKQLGRPKGSKDGKPRKRSGYWLRYARSKQSSPALLRVA